MKIIKINTDNTMNEIDINIKKNNIKNSLKQLDNDKEEIELIYYWTYENNIIECYGYLSSEKNIVNVHKLPNSGISNIINDIGDINLYNNIYIVAKHKNKYIDYYIHNYGNLYYLLNEMDDYSSDNESVNDNNEDIKINNIINTVDNIINNDKELDYDNNNYI